MTDKKLFEFMLEKNMRGELAGSFDSMEMREFLQKGIELFEENERLKTEFDRLHAMISKPEETNRIRLKICGMDMVIRYTDDEKQSVERLGQLEQVIEQLRAQIKVTGEQCQNCSLRSEILKMTDYLSEVWVSIDSSLCLLKSIDAAIKVMKELKRENERLKRENDKLHCQDCAAQAFEVACVLQDYKERNEQLQIAYDMQLKANLVQIDENNKLHAQVATYDLTMKEHCKTIARQMVAIERISYYCHNHDPHNDGVTYCKEIADKALSNSHNPAETEIIIKESNDDELLDEALAYHNPADVKEIERLKEEINTFTHQEQCRAYAGLETTVQDMGNALKLTREFVYNNMPCPANTPKYDEYFQILRVLEKVIGGGEFAEKKAEHAMTLPCKVGDAVKVTAYRPYNGHVTTIFGKVAAIIITHEITVRISYMQCRHIDVLDTDFDKTVFLCDSNGKVLEGGVQNADI